MAWTAPPQLAAGSVLTAAIWNTYVANNEIALENALQVTGIGAATVGTSLGLGAPNMKMQAASAVLTPNANGTFTGTWPIAFPNSLIATLILNADTTTLLGLPTLSNVNTNGTTYSGQFQNVNTNAGITAAARFNIIGIGS